MLSRGKCDNDDVFVEIRLQIEDGGLMMCSGSNRTFMTLNSISQKRPHRALAFKAARPGAVLSRKILRPGGGESFPDCSTSSPCQAKLVS